jgi:hypothetical protein
VGKKLSVAASLTLGIVGTLAKGQLDASLAMTPPVLTRAKALTDAQTANGLLTGSLVTGIVAAVVAVVVVWLFVAGAP